MRQNGPELLAEVLAVISKHDPIGLLKHGAPKDEYSLEAPVVAAAITKCNSLGECRTVVWKVFVEYFGPEVGTEAAFHQLADELFDLIQ